ncbi:hypothetical protein MYX78_06535 [Acidobacteria bacterium AH-259-G07]|nr:hypothetical protein [Acidobacteria bacterium AH-259-G07]
MILIACALRKELSALRGHLQVECRFLVTGPGAKRTRTKLDKIFQSELPSLFVFTGTAGQLDPSLRMGEVILPEEWCLKDGSCFPADPDLTDKLRKHGWDVSGRGLTVSVPVVRAKSRLSLYRKSGALICDMESAAALQVASRYRVPSLAPKIVSDTSDSGVRAFWSEFDNNMDRLARYLEELIGCVGVGRR